MKDHDADVVRETAPRYGEGDNRLTYDDYLRAPAGLRYELVEGELRMVPSPSVTHQDISMRLERMLLEHLQDRGLGKVLHAPCDVVLSHHNVVQPDVFFVSKDRLGIIGKENVKGAPDLVIEILSESTKDWDQVSKRSVYSLYGVREYWIVDPDARTIEVATRRKNKLETVGVYSAGETVLSVILPDLRVDVDPLFAE
ncbi:MAG: Uma2 family endonuclease [Bacillota bacterium]